MKKIILSLIGIISCISLLAQAPNQFKYQAVLRNADGSVMAEESVTILISILKSDLTTTVFEETHNTTTTKQGLIALNIGSIEDLSVVDWTSDEYFIEISVNGTVIGTSQLLSVPYAMHAKTAENITGTITETDPEFTSWDKTTGITISESQVSDLGSYLETETDPAFTGWDKSTGISITESQVSDLGSYLETETDPVYSVSEAANITATDITNLGNLSGTNTGDQDISGIAINEQAIKDTASQIRSDIPIEADGSETKITAGINVSVTGTGTVASPYVINEAGNSLPIYTTVEIASLSPSTGDAVYNSTEELYQIYDGTRWVSLPVSCWPQPTTSNAGDDQKITDGTVSATLAANTPAAEHGSGEWTIVSGTGGSFDDASSPISEFTGNISSIYTLRWTISTSCNSSADDVKIVILASGDIDNPTTGKIWMDRNLGASQVATSSDDAASYGDLYQWGRAADGHESRTSGTTTTLSSSDTPGHGDYITVNSGIWDWRSPQNDNLWQGVSGTNNPCPSGYRLPTEAEWNAEIASWISKNTAGAFASPLKLPLAGYRYSEDGSVNGVGIYGRYWSSTISGTYSKMMLFYSEAVVVNNSRSGGLSVRCIKD